MCCLSRLLRPGIWIIAVCLLRSPIAWAQSGSVPVPTGEPLPVQPPLPVWPSDYETITERKPVFRFNGRFQATAYRVELARDAAFTNPIVLEQFEIVDPGGITPAVAAPYEGEPLADGRYYWRAFAGNHEGFWTPPANYRVFNVSAADRDAIVAPAEPVHPRLLLRASEVPAFKQRIERSAHLRRGWQYILNASTGLLDYDPPDESYARAGAGQHGNYSMAAGWYHRHLENMAFVALVTGEQRFIDKGVEMLMTACSYERWLGPLFDNPNHFNPPWTSALETAMMTEAVAVGYDLLYPHLTEEQRTTVRAALVEKGIKPLVHDWADPLTSARLPRHQLPTGNWVMVCSGSAGVGALAVLGEHPDAPQWVRLVRNRIRAWLHDRGGDWYADNPFVPGRPDPIPVIGPSEPNFGVDGGYKETIGYMDYAMRYVLYFTDALRRETSENLATHIPANLLEPVSWNVLNRPVDGGVWTAMIDFGDTGPSPRFPEVFAGLTRHRSDGRAAWLYRKIIPSPNILRALLWLDPTVPARPPSASMPLRPFRGIGQAVMRPGWSPDSPVAAIKFHQNRGHLDIGTWYLFSGGRPAVIDSGVTQYGGPIYGQYSARSIAHNVVLVDNQQQQRVDGIMLGAVATSDFAAASGELAAAYPDALESWTRDLAVLPGGLVVVFDRLEGKGAHQYDLLLHPGEPFTLSDTGRISVGMAPAITDIDVYSDAKLTHQQEDGYYRTQPRKFLRYASDAPAGRRSFLTVCRLPARPGAPSPPFAVEPLPGGRWRMGWRERDRRLLAVAGGMARGPLQSDARLAVVVDSDRPTTGRHVLVTGGTRLAFEGQELLLATRPIHAAFEWSPRLRGWVWASGPTVLRIAQADASQNIFVNGRKVEAEIADGFATLGLPAGESTIETSEFLRPLGTRPAVMFEDLLAVPEVDAPAYRPGVITRASATGPEGLAAIDGDINTAWASMPGVPLPQWLEIVLPRPERMSRVTIYADLPAGGKLERWDPGINGWQTIGPFEADEHKPARLEFEPADIARLRLTVERADPAVNAARINEIRWE